MAMTVSLTCPICKTQISSTGGGGTVKHFQGKLERHIETHRPKPKPVPEMKDLQQPKEARGVLR